MCIRFLGETCTCISAVSCSIMFTLLDPASMKRPHTGAHLPERSKQQIKRLMLCVGLHTPFPSLGHSMAPPELVMNVARCTCVSSLKPL
jgi:hypothetical protein